MPWNEKADAAFEVDFPQILNSFIPCSENILVMVTFAPFLEVHAEWAGAPSSAGAPFSLLFLKKIVRRTACLNPPLFIFLYRPLDVLLFPTIQPHDESSTVI